MIVMENNAVVMIVMKNIAVEYFLDLRNFESRIVVGVDDTQVVVDKLDRCHLRSIRGYGCEEKIEFCDDGVWQQVQSFTGVPNMPSSLDMIQERNNRLFKNQKKSEDQLIEVIKSTVRLKLLSCKFKKTKNVEYFLHLGSCLSLIWSTHYGFLILMLLMK
ncbi:hypothetical protein Tco_0255810 [Tanacetum coccineum]